VRLLHYEATLSKPEDGVYGCGAHSDYGLFTFLLTDEEPGLEIFFKDSWHAVPPAPSSDVFIVNLGDMSMRLSNDLFKSTVHRVINKTGRERYSIPLFFEPDVRAVIEPICVPGENPHYAPIS
jgi:isopenicillin N synthase-like dioxygenase